MPPRTRRTQEERREETRLKLLDATITALLDGGYAGTTTRRVCELSGVSQGAQSYHFPQRVDLVIAAVEHMAETRIAELQGLAAELPDDLRERAAVLLDVLWADFSSPAFTVFVKLWAAAADDPELHDRLIPVERTLTRALQRLGRDVATDEWRERGFDKDMRIAVETCRGLALTMRFEPRAARRRDPWPDVREWLLDALTGGRR